MTEIEFHTHSKCSSCRSADVMLTARGLGIRRRDLFKERMSAAEIRQLLSRTGLAVSDLLSTRSVPYRELGLAGKPISDDDIVGLMAAHPALIRRPIAVFDDRAVVGFTNGACDDMTPALRASRSDQE